MIFAFLYASIWASQVAQWLKIQHVMQETQVGKILWRRAWQPTLIFLPGEFQGQISLAGYSSQGFKESDMTEMT